MTTAPIVTVRDLVKTVPLGGAELRAVDGVSFTIDAGATLGLVGESGSGKSTTGRMLVGLIPASAGEIRVFDRLITGRDGARGLRAVRRRLQFVFQDPFSSLDPRMRVADIIAEPIDIAGGYTRRDRRDRVAELLEMVGLPRVCAERYPHEFSGGQRQRIGIARALALRPAFLVCDEPVSALDVSMQAQIVNLLLDLQQQFGLSYLFIAHDLAVVCSISTTVAVMYAGTIVELAPRQALFTTPAHPYTRALLAAVPRPDPGAVPPTVIGGELPHLLDIRTGCAFRSRCPRAGERCATERPPLAEIAPGHHVACHHADSPLP